MNQVVHLTEQEVRSVKVIRNLGRQMVAGTTGDLIERRINNKV